MNESLQNLTTDEIYELYSAHSKKHGYERITPKIEEIIIKKGRWARDYLISLYEQRTDVWEEYKKFILEQINREIKIEDVKLFEHPQGSSSAKDKVRKKPSLWSHELSKEPATVEVAAANHYRNQGYEVSLSFSLFERVLLRAYVLSRYSAKDPAWLHRDEPEKMIDINIVDFDSFSKSLNVTIIMNLKEFKKFSMMGGPLANREKLAKLKAMPKIERDELLEAEFCNWIVMGSSTLGELKDKLIEAHRILPRNFLSNYFIHSSLYGIRSGIPDLFIWNKTGLDFVEVKSPNDKLHHNQAKFYHFILKRIGMKYNVAKIVSSKY